MMTLRPIRTTVAAFLAVTIAGLALQSSAASANVTTERFANTTAVSIPTAGTANPYPSTIAVSGMPGRVTDVTVGIEGFKHGHPRDVDILLVSPSGRGVILASDACGSNEITSGRWTFNQDFGEPISETGPCPSGIYRPTNYPGSITDQTWRDAFPNAPTGTRTTDLNSFVDEDPNGNWRLYVNDERAFKGGSLPSGWSITISSAPQDIRLPSGAAGEGGPYPATRTIDGVDGLITDVNVGVGSIYHEKPKDLDLLLVGPRGQKVLLQSDACGPSRSKNVSIGYDDEAAAPVPAGTCSTGNYKPTDYEPGESLPMPAPAGPYATSLSEFDNTNPNGEWRLYAADDESDGRGFITDRFTLDIKTRPRAAVAFSARTAEVAEGETAQVKLVRTGPDAPVAGSVKVTSSPLSATSGTDYEPVSTTVEFAAGQKEKTVPVRALTDAPQEGDEKFLLTVGDANGDALVGSPAAAEVTIKDRSPRVDQNGGGQDGGGQNGGGQNGGQNDTQAPAISALKLKPSRFTAVRRRTARARGTVIRYSLSEAANVTVRIERLRGRKFVRAGNVRGAGKAGSNAVRFTGLIGRRLLKPGTYRLRVVARDAAGNESTSSARRFRVIKSSR